MDYETIINQLADKFKQKQNITIALKQSKYMLNQFEYYGIQTPLRRQIQLEILNYCSTFEISDILILCDFLVAKEQREYLYFVQDLIYKVHKRLSTADIKYVIKNFITKKAWWDNCDGFVMSIYRWTQKNQQKLSQIANFCLRYKNLWIRRCGILLQLHHQTFNQTVFDKTLHANITNQEFFIQKAFGWFLRELGKKDYKTMLYYYTKYNNEFTKVAKREMEKQIKKQSNNISN